MMSYNINVVLIYYIGNDELACVVSGRIIISRKNIIIKKNGREEGL